MIDLEEIRERLMDELSNANRRHFCPGVAYCGCYASAIGTAEQIVMGTFWEFTKKEDE